MSKIFLASATNRKYLSRVADIMAPMRTAMEGDRLSNTRARRLKELVHDVQVYAKRAKTPEDRITWAELEHELLEVEKRWQRNGLINGQEELPLAADRS